MSYIPASKHQHMDGVLTSRDEATVEMFASLAKANTINGFRYNIPVWPANAGCFKTSPCIYLDISKLQLDD
jgi:hypothetical protein